jgi:hypothetical protein
MPGPAAPDRYAHQSQLEQLKLAHSAAVTQLTDQFAAGVIRKRYVQN